MAIVKKRLKKRAYVACNGGGNNHSCTYGCIGCGACAAACRKDAITIDENGLAHVSIESCVGCRLCEKACPQGIIHMRSLEENFVVLCSNRDKGPAARTACDASCIGCGLCTKNCPSEAIRVIDGCAIVEEDLCLSCGNCVVKCPRKAVHDLRGFIK